MNIRKVEVLLFDTHLALNPLLDPSLVQPELAWLVDPEAYNELYAGQERPLETEHFTLHRVRRELGRRRNHFWRAYAATVWGAQSAWEKVLPFRFVPKRDLLPLEVAIDLGAVEARPDAWTLVWPFGWSNNLRLTLQGHDLTLGELREKLNFLLKSQAFRMGNEPAYIEDVFKSLSYRLKGDVYARGQLLGDSLGISHFLVAAITASEPPLPRYDDPAVPQSDWARIFGLVLGREVPVAEVSELEKRLTITRFTEGGFEGAFAISEFNRPATFLFLSGATQKGKGERAFSCTVANVETATLIGLAFSRFVQKAKKLRPAKDHITALVKGAEEVLINLPDDQYYQNWVCRDIWKNHGSLKPYWTANHPSESPA